jgi:hypothetical protein
LGPVGPIDKENKVKMYKKYGTVLGILTLWNGKDPDPYQIEKQDPDPYQSDKQDPDPYQKGLDPQHWSWRGRKWGTIAIEKTQIWVSAKTFALITAYLTKFSNVCVTTVSS